MFGFLRRRAELKRRAHIRAEALLARHGEEAWQIVYGICRGQDRDLEDRLFYYRVRDIIEQRLGMPPRVDTATRYLESSHASMARSPRVPGGGPKDSR